MSLKKESGGVQATIERLTGKRPCPQYLRAALNKYLNSPLFQGSRRPGQKIPQKQALQGADTLVMNALNLDQVFQGDTKTVTNIITKEISEVALRRKIEAAEGEIRRRFDTYGYWVQRIDALKSVLLDQSVDLKTVRLDARLAAMPAVGSLSQPTPFALRAIQQLEHIEERGRLAQPSANEYAEQADAYLSLGDFIRPEKKRGTPLKLIRHTPVPGLSASSLLCSCAIAPATPCDITRWLPLRSPSPCHRMNPRSGKWLARKPVTPPDTMRS